MTTLVPLNRQQQILLSQIRVVLGLFMFGLFAVGLSVLPIISLANCAEQFCASHDCPPSLQLWLNQVVQALSYNSAHYPFMLYTLDWLAFAHMLIAIVFIGAWRDPVRNIWVIEFGMIACVLTLPAIVWFGVRNQIPSFWGLIDACFGLIALIPLNIARQKARQLAVLCLPAQHG